MADQEVVTLLVRAKDEVSGVMGRATSSIERFGDSLHNSRGAIREFGRLGSELSTIAGAISPEFGLAVQGVSEFIRVSADVGKASATVLTLGPAAAQAAAATVGLGNASAATAAATGLLGASSSTTAAGVELSGAAAATAATEYDALTIAETTAGGAASAAAGESLGLAAAENTAAASADTLTAKLATLGTSGVLGLLTNFVALGGGVAFAGQMVQRENSIFDEAYDAAHKQSSAVAGLSSLTAALGTIVGATSVAEREYAARVNGTTSAQGEAKSITTGYVKTLSQQIGYLDGASKATAGLAGETENLGGAASGTARHLSQLYGDPVEAAFQKLGTALTDEENYLYQVAYAATVATRNLAAMGAVQVAENNAARSRLRQLGEDPGAGVSGALQHGFITAAPGDYTPRDAHADLPNAEPVAHSGAGGGGHTAKGGGLSAAATAAAQAAEEARQQAWQAAKEAGDNYFDAMHTRNDQAIEDAHKERDARIESAHQTRDAAIEAAHQAAQDQIAAADQAWQRQTEDAERSYQRQTAAARQSIDDQLQQQLRLDAGSVTAAEKALQDVQNARRQRDLDENLKTATASGDQKQIRSAKEAISDFEAEQRIAQLREQQQAADDAARAAAKAAQDTLDAQRQKHEDDLVEAQRHEQDNMARARKDADEIYARQKAEEDARYERQKADEDKRYDVAKHDEDTRYARQKKLFDDHIDALEKSKKATEHMADVETLRYLQQQVQIMKEFGDAQDVKYAIADLTAFQKSTGISHHAQGGWAGLGGPELSWLGENGPEFVVSNDRLGGLGVNLHGDVHLHGVQNPQKFMLELQRLARTNGYSAIPAAR